MSAPRSVPPLVAPLAAARSVPRPPLLRTRGTPAVARVLCALALLLALLALAGPVTPSGWTSSARAELSAHLPKARARAGGQVFRLDVAELPDEQSLGLGGRKALLPDEGMLFVYKEKERSTFWMHGMLIAIDLLWIDNDRIVHIVHRAPPPAPGTPDDALPLYKPPSPANFVLEIAAGRSQALGLKVGDRVEFDFSGR